MHSSRNKIAVGFLLLLAWCFISAFSRVFTGSIEQTMDPILLGFYISITAVGFFIIVSLKDYQNLIIKIRNNYQNIVWINITTVGCWVFLLYPLKYLEPAIVSAITLCITPYVTLVLGRSIYKKQVDGKYDYLVALALLVLAAYLIGLGFLHKTAVKNISLVDNMVAVLCCFIVGMSLAFNNIYAKRLSDASFSPIETLTVRFILMLLCTGLLSIVIKSPAFVSIDMALIKDILLASFSLIILPQLVYQQAIRELQPVSVAIILPLMPVLVFFLEYFDARLQPAAYTIIGVAIIPFITLMGFFSRYYTEKRSIIIKGS